MLFSPTHEKMTSSSRLTEQQISLDWEEQTFTNQALFLWIDILSLLISTSSRKSITVKHSSPLIICVNYNVEESFQHQEVSRASLITKREKVLIRRQGRKAGHGNDKPRWSTSLSSLFGPETGLAKDHQLKLLIRFPPQRALSRAPRALSGASASGFHIFFRSSLKLYLSFTCVVLLVCPFGLSPSSCAQTVSCMTIFQSEKHEDLGGGGDSARRKGSVAEPQGNSDLGHSGTSQGYRDQAACSQLWSEGFPLSCCGGSGNDWVW